ncbi:uncharacterized protein [Euwallacea fornicatus]|uniref:uncharacterized protein n=1 Tax=Euwallacea fornicatus TaxID=995702 RepID=UPI00338FED55
MSACSLICDVCGKEIPSFPCGLRELQRHQKFAHQSWGPSKRPNIKCQEEGCPFWCYKLKAFRSHLENDHSLKQEMEELWFRDSREFELWKSSEELQTSSRWVRTGGKTDKLVTIHYYCHRTGRVRLTSKRKKQNLNSCKLNNYCTSTISLINSPQGIKVHYYPIHYGHDSQLNSTSLSVDVKDVIALELMKGKSVSEVFSALKGSNIVEVTRKHVHAIAVEYGIKDFSLKSELGQKRSTIKQNHIIAANACDMLVVKLENEWKVKSSQGVFTVKLVHDSCRCKVKCPRCLVCMHAYSCTCEHYLAGQNMCEHIHKVCLMLPQVETCPEEPMENHVSREEVRNNAQSILNLCDQGEGSNADWESVNNLLKQAIDFITKPRILNGDNDNTNIVADDNLLLIGPTATDDLTEDHGSTYSLLAMATTYTD